MNHQIQSAVTWWLKFLAEYVPLLFPCGSRRWTWWSATATVRAHKRGLESQYGRKGVPMAPSPLSVKSHRRYGTCGTEGRGLKSTTTSFLIEAIGPLSILETFPHFIDNVAAEHSLIKGSSSITSGDVMVGATWDRIQKLNVYPFLDRVMSESNPVDGLSRGRPNGPWKHVLKARLPQNLERLLEAEAA